MRGEASWFQGRVIPNYRLSLVSLELLDSSLNFSFWICACSSVVVIPEPGEYLVIVGKFIGFLKRF